MTINQAIAAAVAEWRADGASVTDAELAALVRQLVDEAIVEHLPNADDEEEQG